MEEMLNGFTYTFLSERFSYDHLSGEITRRKTGRVLTALDKAGYSKISVRCEKTKKEKQIYGHRLAWFLFYKIAPKKGQIVDHINGDSSDNRLANLRLTSQAENCRNKRMQKNNKTGHAGVYNTNSGKFGVRVAGRYIGTYSDACTAFKIAYREYSRLGYGPAHGTT